MEKTPRFIALLSMVTTVACGSGQSIDLLDFSDILKQQQGLAVDHMKQRSFSTGSDRYVAMDFTSVDLTWTFDNSLDRTTGEATVEFRVHDEGVPYFLLNGTILSASIDGEAANLSTVMDPERLNTLVHLGTALTPGKSYKLQLTYRMDPAEVSYRSTGIGFITSMADITNGNFFENYGPANFEDDQFQLKLRAKILGASQTHQVFANGSVAQNGTYDWSVTFPAYFNSSSFFFHVTTSHLYVQKAEYQGLEKKIPLIVYSQTSSYVSQGMASLKNYMQELEATYGPYQHGSFVAYIYGAGGMEHVGATITSLSALDHELTHSWFARGVMPISGNAGWIDEAIASWRDYGYQRSSGALRSATNLADFSAFQRFTPYNAYADGRALMADLDALFAEKWGGLRPVLKEFFSFWRTQVVSTPVFQGFLEQGTGENVTPLFDRHVYGRSNVLPGQVGEPDEEKEAEKEEEILEPSGPRGKHPPALTREDVEKLR